ncbi:MAG TPA: hypothetical protein VML19_24320 [Verrucomicrobiae bacterium]|nr:hypothetical protein [Verrucomicrobiae bacterium]
MRLSNGRFSFRTAGKYVLTAVVSGFVAAALALAAAQPHMQAALTALQNAAGQLQQAADDKSGHREKAINLVSQAILQVQQGIQAGASNKK